MLALFRRSACRPSPPMRDIVSATPRRAGRALYAMLFCAQHPMPPLASIQTIRDTPPSRVFHARLIGAAATRPHPQRVHATPGDPEPRAIRMAARHAIRRDAAPYYTSSLLLAR